MLDLNHWCCDECGSHTKRLDICWGMSGGQKVDLIDFFCPSCSSNKLTWLGTAEKEKEYWDKEWEGSFNEKEREC